MELEFQTVDGPVQTIRLDFPGGEAFRLALGDSEELAGTWKRINPFCLSLLTDGGKSHLVHLALDVSGTYHLHLNGKTYRLQEAGEDSPEVGHSSAGSDSGGTINDNGEVLSPMPGKVVDISVSVGDTVASGDLLLVLESMKMENPILSPVDGQVLELPVGVGEQASLGDALVKLEVKA